jgi:hypothetical protein
MLGHHGVLLATFGGMEVTLDCLPLPLGVTEATFGRLEAALGSLGAHFEPP